MMDDQIDVCVMMETWLKPEDDLVVKQVPPQGYKMSYPWHNGCTVGGLAIVCWDFLQGKVIDNNDYASKFETMETRCFHLEFGAHCIVL